MIRLIAGIVVLLGRAASAAAQTPNFAWLPGDARPEFRAQLEASSWARRWNSAAGWIVLSERQDEQLLYRGPPVPAGVGEHSGDDEDMSQTALDRPEAERVYSCLPDLKSASGERAHDVFALYRTYHVKEILAGNTFREAARLGGQKCYFPQTRPLPQPFDVAAPTPSEFRSDPRSYSMLIIYLPELSRLAAPPENPKVETIRYAQLEIKESDSKLAAGAVIDTLTRQQWTSSNPARFQPKPTLQHCRIDGWRKVGEGAEALPFEAVHIGCDYGAAEERLMRWSWIVPELGLFLESDFEKTGGANVVREAPGRWRIRAQLAPAGTIDTVILSPGAVQARLSPRR